MEPVEQAIEELRSALTKAQRLSGHDMSTVQKAIHEMPLMKTARNRFIDEFKWFLKSLNGSVLPLEGRT